MTFSFHVTFWTFSFSIIRVYICFGLNTFSPRKKLKLNLNRCVLVCLFLFVFPWKFGRNHKINKVVKCVFVCFFCYVSKHTHTHTHLHKHISGHISFSFCLYNSGTYSSCTQKFDSQFIHIRVVCVHIRWWWWKQPNITWGLLVVVYNIHIHIYHILLWWESNWIPNFGRVCECVCSASAFNIPPESIWIKASALIKQRERAVIISTNQFCVSNNDLLPPTIHSDLYETSRK